MQILKKLRVSHKKLPDQKQVNLLYYLLSGLYGCEVEKIVIDSPNTRIAQIAGEHPEGNTYLEVEYVWIKDSNTPYLPYFDAQAFFPNLLKYIITNSNVQVIKREDFSSMPKLQTLNLVDNKIELIPEDALYDIGGLIDFFIDNNKIKKLPEYLLNHAPMFQRFMAQNNSIEAIEKDFFKNNPILKIVSLENNKIAKVKVDFRPFRNLKKLGLKNNTCIDSYYNDWRKYKSVLIIQDEIETLCKWIRNEKTLGHFLTSLQIISTLLTFKILQLNMLAD